MHLDLDQAIPLARFAAAALDVERKTPGTVTALARFLHLGEQFANRREESGVRRGIRSRRAADRALIDADDFIEVLKTFDFRVRRRLLRAVVQMPRDRVIDGVVDERRFSRS